MFNHYSTVRSSGEKRKDDRTTIVSRDMFKESYDSALCDYFLDALTWSTIIVLRGSIAFIMRERQAPD